MPWRTRSIRWTAHGVATLSIASMLVACGGGGGGGSASTEIAQGHEEYKKVCAVCHGQNGEGMAQLGKDLRGNEFVKTHSDEELLAFIIEGRPATHPDNTRGVDMPPRGGNPNVTDEQILQIVAYMRSLE